MPSGVRNSLAEVIPGDRLEVVVADEDAFAARLVVAAGTRVVREAFPQMAARVYRAVGEAGPAACDDAPTLVEPFDLGPEPGTEAIGEPVEPVALAIADMPHQVEAAREADLVGQDLAQHPVRGQREIMRNAKPVTLLAHAQLHRNRVRGERDAVDPQRAEIVEIGVVDHVGDIADEAMRLEVFRRRDRGAVAQILAGGDDVQAVIGDPVHGESTRRGRADRDGEIGLAPQARSVPATRIASPEAAASFAAWLEKPDRVAY